jgi:hypothetical protein
MSSLRALAVAAMVLIAVLFLSLNSGTWLISPDSTDYVEGARSLASLQGFADASGRPQTLAPPGTSAVYAFAALVPAADFFYFNLLTKLLAIAFVALAYVVARQAAGDAVGLMVALVLAFNQRLLFESTRILSDIPFSVVFMATLWLFPQDRLDSLSARAALALGGLLAAGYVLRPPGLLVYFAYTAYIVTSVRTNRVRTVVLVSAVFAAVVLALWVRSQVAGGSNSYWQLFFLRRAWVVDSGFPGVVDWYERITGNGAKTIRLIVAAFSNDEQLSVAALVVVLLLTVGVATQLATRRLSLHVYVLVAYLPWLVMPPAGPEPRYLLPVLPLLGVMAAGGASLVVGRLPGERARSTTRFALLALITIGAWPYWTHGFQFAGNMRTELRHAQGRLIIYPGHDQFVQLVEQQRGTLRPTDVVATMHANVLRYFLPAGIRVSNIPITEDVDTAHRRLRDAGTTVIYGDKTEGGWQYLEPVIRAYPASFALEADNREAAIYRMRPSAQTSVR